MKRLNKIVKKIKAQNLTIEEKCDIVQEKLEQILNDYYPGSIDIRKEIWDDNGDEGGSVWCQLTPDAYESGNQAQYGINSILEECDKLSIPGIDLYYDGPKVFYIFETIVDINFEIY